MKKLSRIVALLLCVALALALTACKAPDHVEEEEPTDAPTPSATPTQAVPTVEPTVTPRPMGGGVEYPSAGATMTIIDPVDKPTHPPITFADGDFVEVREEGLGLSFLVPNGWVRQNNEQYPSAVVYEEPAGAIRNLFGVPCSVTVSVSSGYANAQTTRDAESRLDEALNLFRQEFPSLEVSSKADNNMMGETGRYVTFWYELDRGPDEEPLRMRGRYLAVPKDKKIYLVHYVCPAVVNAGYEEVYKKLRGSIKEL